MRNPQTNPAMLWEENVGESYWTADRGAWALLFQPAAKPAKASPMNVRMFPGAIILFFVYKMKGGVEPLGMQATVCLEVELIDPPTVRVMPKSKIKTGRSLTMP